MTGSKHTKCYRAVKVLAPYLAGSGAARKRFSREARAAAAVVHEHVVAIHNVESGDDRPQGDATLVAPFLVMQHVAGESLQQRIDRVGPLELCEILRIGMQTASGLEAAHQQGLVHRDVKPSNILLRQCLAHVQQPTSRQLPSECREGIMDRAQPALRRRITALLAICLATAAIYAIAQLSPADRRTENADSVPLNTESYSQASGLESRSMTSWDAPRDEIESLEQDLSDFQSRFEQSWDSSSPADQE